MRNPTARALGGIPFGGGALALALHEPRDGPVQLELRTVNLEFGRLRDPLGEHRFRGPLAVALSFREVDHRFLGPAQVERGPLAVHGLADGFDVGVGVAVEQLQEEREVLRVTFVWGGGQQENVVGAVAE